MPYRRLPRCHPFPESESATDASLAPHHTSSSSSLIKSPAASRHVLSSKFRAPRGGKAPQTSCLEFVAVPRRPSELSTPKGPTSGLTEQQTRERARSLLDQAEYLLSSGWSTVQCYPWFVRSERQLYPHQSSAEHMPLDLFIYEILRRGKVNFVTLRTALSYVEAVAHQVPLIAEDEDAYMRQRNPSVSSGEFHEVQFELRIQRHKPTSSAPSEPNEAVPACPSTLLCARQVFLASVVLAAKFVTDRSYSCKAWSKLSGNAVRDVVRAEREVLAALGWNLWIGTGPQPTQAEALLDTEPVVPANGVFVPKDKPLVTFLEPPASDSDLSPPAFDGVDGVGPLQLAGSTETQSTSHGAYEDELSM